jgi:molybdopterin-guanine dinucleotide biosynthesis protein A
VAEGAGAPTLRGLVLAGGRSERLGRDKAAVELDGTTLLARAVAALGTVVTDVRVAVRGDQLAERLRSRFTLLADAGEGIGPAAGILAAHGAEPAAAWLVLACDMPGADAAFLRTLVAARDPARAATAFRAPVDGRPEPLCAIYEPATLAAFRRHVAAGGNPSPRSWLAAAHPLLLDAPLPEALGSINTPEDLEHLAGALRGPGGAGGH